MHFAFARSVACISLLFLLSACAGLSASSAPENGLGAVQHEALADLQLRAGRPDLAAAGYEKALGFRPGDAGLFLKRGQALLRLSEPGPALEAFRAALAARPDFAAALNGAGECLYRLERPGEAEAALRRAVALAPDNWRGHCLLGLVFEAEGRPQQAVAEYLAALAQPDSGTAQAELLNNLGVAQALAGDPEAGARTLRAALAAGPSPEGMVPVGLAKNLGLILVRLGRFDEALAAFRLTGDDPRALNNMGYALLQRGEPQTAQALFEKALQASPTYYRTAGENLARAALATDMVPELIVAPVAAAVAVMSAPAADAAALPGLDPDADLIPELPGWPAARLLGSGAPTLAR